MLSRAGIPGCLSSHFSIIFKLENTVDDGVKKAFQEKPDTNIDLVGRIINEAGGGPALAKAVGLKSASIYKWRRSRGIPCKYAIAIEKATNGAVSRFEICTELVEILTAPPAVPQGRERPKRARDWRYEARLAA
uniref:DNA-binding transcriptional regulator Cro n=1 Tax=Candidatus Kentrum sp. LPFa TaxID=2126335 RepID=A0A450WMC1_9GAMM|nr:MAG: DNA-binding transcriptional regulator Cro [Candidatus Kentron sp. LPFa]